MKKKPRHHRSQHHHHPQKLNQLRVRFAIAALTIGALFLASLLLLLFGNFRPTADVTPSTTLQSSLLQYTDTSTGQSYFLQSNSLNLAMSPNPLNLIALQGTRQTNAPGLVKTGTITVHNGNTLIGNANTAWSTNGYNDNTYLKADINDQNLLNSLDFLPLNANLHLVLKPKNYLSVAVNTSNIDSPVTLPFAPVGDLNNDNKIDEGDFARWASHFGQTTTSATQDFDFNHDGVIDEADFTLGFAINFDKTGAQ